MLVLSLLVLSGARNSASAQSCDIHVNPSDGSDSNLGTRFQPVQSLETGFSLADTGQRLCLASGEYFGGSDADGIFLTGTDKSLTIVLSTFAGNSRFIFSEKSISIDIGSGTLDFEFSGSESIYFGAGQLNTNDLFPDATNFLHSFILVSGTLNFGDIPVVFGESVGNPFYVNSSNSDKTSPASARIQLGNSIQGSNVLYTEAPRVWEFSGGTPGIIRTASAPSLVANSSLVFSNSGPVQVTEMVTLVSESTVLVTAASVSEVSFTNGITLNEGAKITHAGSNTLMFDLFAPDNGEIFVESVGEGILVLNSLTNATDAIINVSIPSGSVHINSPMIFKGVIDLQSSMEINADVTIDLNTSKSPSFLMSGMLSHGNHSVTLTHDFSSSTQLIITESAQFSGQPIKLEGFFELTGGGLGRFEGLNPFRIESNNVSLSDSIRVGLGSSLVLKSSDARIEGTLYVAGGTVDIQASEVFFDNFEMTSGELVPHGAFVNVNGRFLVSGGTTNTVDLKFTSVTAGVIDVAEPIGSVQIAESNLQVIGHILSTADCNVSGSTLEIVNEASFTCSTVQTSQNSLIQLGTGSRLVSTGTIDLTDASLLTQSGSRLVVGGSLLLGSSGTYDTGNSTISWTGMLQRIESPKLTDWLDFSWISPDATLEIDGRVGLKTNLVLTDVTMLLQNNSVLRLDGDLDISVNHFSFSSSSALIMQGGNIRSLDSGSTILLPSTFINNDTTIDSNFVINGSLTLANGVFSLPDHISGRVSGNLVSMGGGMVVNSGSTMSIDGSTNTTSGLITLANESVLEVQNKVVFTDVSTDFSRGMLRFVGDATLLFDAVLRTEILDITSNVDVVLLASNLELATNGFSLLTGASLNLGNGTLRLGSRGRTLNLLIQGTITGSSEAKTLIQGSGGTILGQGQLANLVLDLDTEMSEMILESEIFSLNQSIKFQFGILTVRSQSLNFIATESFLLTIPIRNNKLISNFSFSQVTNVNQDSTPISLILRGALSAFLSYDSLLELGPLSNLDISVPDLFNSPPVFGMVTDVPITLSGSLILSENTLIRSPSITIQSDNTDSIIAGTIDTLIVNGSGNISGEGSGTIGSLFLDSGSLTLANIKQIRTLSLTNAQLSLSGEHDILFQNSISVNASTLNMNVQGYVAGSSQSASFNLINSQLVFGESGDLFFESPVNVWFDANSEVVADPAKGGEIHFFSGSFLTIETPIPRVSISGPLSQIVLNSNLSISDRLVSTKGSIELGSWNLSFDSASWFYGGSRVFSNQSSSTSTITFSGNSALNLSANLLLENSNLTIDATNGPIAVRSSNNGARKITLQNGQLQIRNGILDLASNDIIVQGNRQPIMTLNNSQVSSTILYPELELNSRLKLPSLTFPFSNHLVGEIVVEGPSGSEIRSIGTNTVSALRIERAISLPPDNTPIQVTQRFSYGHQNASVNMNGPGSLVFGQGTQLIRRGSGALSHAPVFLGPVSVGYNLDDGTVISPASVFFLDELVTGFEIPPVEIGVNHFAVMSGNSNDQIHIVKLNQNLRVLGSLSVFSGIFNQADQDVSFETGSSLALFELDERAPSSYRSNRAYSVTGEINLVVRSISASKVLTTSFFPAGIPVDRFDIDAGQNQSTISSRIFLQGDREANNIHISTSSGSSVNLFGSSLTAADTLAIHGGAVSSDQFSTMRASNFFELSTNASIVGNISIVAKGNALLNGELRVLTFDAAGDTVIGGTWGPNSSIKFSGQNQQVTFETDELVFSNLTIDSVSEDGETVFSGPNKSVLKVSHKLALISGRLNTGRSSIIIQPSAIIESSEFSWLLGVVKRAVKAGFTGDVLFPLGSKEKKFPLSLTIPSPLLSSTIFSLTLFEQEPMIKAGLPTQINETIVQNTDTYWWKLTSTVNFGSAQPFSISSELDSDIGFEEVLLTLQVGNALDQWKSGPIKNDTRISSGTINEGLSPTGLRVSPGVSNRKSDWIFFQFLDAWAESSNVKADIYLNDELWISDVKPGETTPIVPVTPPQNGFLLATSTLINQDPINNILAVIEVPFQVGSLTRLVQAKDTPSSPRLLTSLPIQAAPGVQVLYLALSEDVIDLSKPWPESTTIVTNLSANTFSETSSSLTQASTLKVVSAAKGISFSKFASFPTSAFPNLIIIGDDLRMGLLGNDGVLNRGIVSTDLLKNPVVPFEFSFDSIYPNPAQDHASVIFSIKNDGPVLMELFDLIGKKIFSNILTDVDPRTKQIITLDTKYLAAGSYFLSISSDGKRESKALTIIR